MMLMRVIGGALYLAGWLLLAYNLWRHRARGAARQRHDRGLRRDEPAARTPG